MPQRELRAEQYQRRGLLAIAPKAFMELFFVGDATPENTTLGDATIVDVRGPLELHAHPFYDSYPAILDRIRTACVSATTAVIVRFDSPGGMAQGCFEAAREARAICDAAGKQYHAYVEGDCCSAAYAFASQCQSVTIGDAALIGSIGVLSAREDYSAANTAAGIRVALITSGERKADGHPDQAISDNELAATQAIVDSLADVFVQQVATARGLQPEALKSLQATILHGQSAVAAGLADEVGTLQSVLMRVAGEAEGTNNMAATAYEKARAALEEAAKGDDPNAKAAQRALAAFGGDEDKPADDPDKAEGDPPPATDDDKDKAAGDPPATDDDKKAAAAAYREALKATAEVTKLKAELAKRDEAAERAKLLASKPMAPEMLQLLQKAPMHLVRETVAALPEAPLNPQLEGAPLRGDSTHSGARLSAADKQRLDERMGLATANPTAQSTDFKLVLGASNNTKPQPTN